MRILRAPISTSGHVRYLELFKWLFLVMTVVMSFSYVINSLEEQVVALMNVFYLISVGIVFGEFIYSLYEGLCQLKVQIESYLVPWLQRELNQWKYEIVNSIISWTKAIQQTTIKTFDSTHICVMRC
jgi:hypothetical protein